MAETAKVTISAKISSAFTRSFSNASKSVTSFTNKIKSLNRLTSGGATKLNGLTAASNKASASIRKAGNASTQLKSKMQSLNTKINETNNRMKALSNKNDRAIQQNHMLANSLDKVAAGYNRVRGASNMANSGLRPGGAGTGSGGGAAASSGVGLSSASGAALATGAATLFGATRVLRDPLSFENVVQEISTRSGLGKDQTSDLTSFFRSTAATSLFKSEEVGQAGLFLAKSGFGLEDTKKTLPAVLNLASAEGSDLGFASDFVTDIIDQFGLRKDQATEVVDTLSKASNIATMDIFQLREAFINFGSTANQMGISLQESSAMMGLLAKAGLKGAKGTAVMQTALLKLSDPTAEAKAAIQEYGLQIFDVNGKFVGLDSLLAQLQKTTDGLSEQDGTKLITDLLGTRGASRILAILNQRDQNTGLRGVNLYRKQLEEINNAQGFASQLAKAREETVTGMGKLLLSTFGETQNLLFFGNKQSEFGEGPLQKSLKSLVTTLDGLANGFNKIVAINPDLFGGLFLLVTGLAALGVVLGAIGLFLSGIMTGLAFFAPMVPVFIQVATAIGNITQLLGFLFMAANPLVQAFIVMSGVLVGLNELIRHMTGKSVTQRIGEGIRDQFGPAKMADHQVTNSVIGGGSLSGDELTNSSFSRVLANDSAASQIGGNNFSFVINGAEDPEMVAQTVSTEIDRKMTELTRQSLRSSRTRFAN